MIGVVVASKLAVIREGMKRILMPHEDIKVVGEINLAEEIRPPPLWSLAQIMVVVHSSAAACDDHLHWLRRECPSLQLIVVAPSPSLAQVQSALQLGARGLLHSACAVGQLPAAIRAVSAGRLYLNKEISRLIAVDVQELGKDHSHRALTQRELEIFTKLASGRKVSEIAAELAISVKTVSTHKSRIMEKMGIGSFSELIQYAINHRLLETEDGIEGKQLDGAPAETVFRYANEKR